MNRLRELREGRGWSQAELSRRANMNASTIGQIENGRLIPYEVQIRKIAKALGVSPDELDFAQPGLRAQPE